LEEPSYQTGYLFLIPQPDYSNMKEEMKAYIHENTYAADGSGKVIPIGSPNTMIKAATDLLIQKLVYGFNDPEEEANFYQACLPLNNLMTAFISRKGRDHHPHWISTDMSIPVSQSPLRWAGTKAEAVEIIYELVHVGVINNGKATIMQVTKWFEQEFQIDLGNVSKIFQDIRNRKKEITTLALRMDKALRLYIEQLDEEDLKKSFKAKRA
jgi:RteC protein